MPPRSPFADDRNSGAPAAQPLSASSELGSLDDTGLATRSAAGCQDAFTVLFDRYSAQVFRIARGMLRDFGEAEETVQQVFMDVYRSLSQFDPAKGAFKPWLMQFAYHRTINRREHLLARRFYDWKQLDDMLPAELSDGASRPFQLSSQELGRLVEELLGTLAPRHRRVLELTFYDGLTAEEIAKSCGETASTVRHTLYRSLGKLHSALREAGQKKQTATADAVTKESVYVVSPRTL